MENLCRNLIGYLQAQNEKNGRLKDHHKEMETLVIGEYKACVEDFKNKKIDNELVSSFYKISKLFEVLTIFDITDEMRNTYKVLAKNAQKNSIRCKKHLSDTKKPPQKDISHNSFLSKVKVKVPLTPHYPENPAQTNNNQNSYNQNSYTQSSSERLQIQNSIYENIFPINLTEKNLVKNEFETNVDMEGLFNKVSIEVEAHTSSFVRDKFKNNLHKVTSFENMKKLLKQARNTAENKDLKKCYKMSLMAYNNICQHLN